MKRSTKSICAKNRSFDLPQKKPNITQKCVVNKKINVINDEKDYVDDDFEITDDVEMPRDHKFSVSDSEQSSQQSTSDGKSKENDKDKVIKCIREKGNWAHVKKQHQFEKDDYDPIVFDQDIDINSPKLVALLDKIKELDDFDMEKHGKVFKHFIYSDIKSAYGAKIIAASLIAKGYENVYDDKLQIKNGTPSFNTFALLPSSTIFSKPMTVKLKKEILSIFNSRPDNTYGKNIRIIILDTGYKEGIDLFDVKYVHIFEPLLTTSDQKQTIGRATRFCGQKGLPFDPKKGWPLKVFIYDTLMQDDFIKFLKENIDDKSFRSSNTHLISDLIKHISNIDVIKQNLMKQLDFHMMKHSIDSELTKNIHVQKGGNMKSIPNTIFQTFNQFKWPEQIIRNGCVPQEVEKDKRLPGDERIVSFSPTQNFVRHFFTPKIEQKGILLVHSVGTGKTCSATAIASTSFEKQDYSIIYVTRHTLKSDVIKNIHDKSCHIGVRNILKNETKIPGWMKDKKLPPKWFNVLSYKQFSNALKENNDIGKKLIDINGKSDPLRKTLLIIDEAHKLYSLGGSKGNEKPDMDFIEKMINNSYEKSGKDSVKVLLMTATPYIDDPMELIQLINLMLPKDNKLPIYMQQFKELFLDSNGSFTEKGNKYFSQLCSKYISYLNRENDITMFAYPIIETVYVTMSEYSFKKELDLFDEKNRKIKVMNYLLDIMKGNMNSKVANFLREVQFAKEKVNQCKNDLINVKNRRPVTKEEEKKFKAICKGYDDEYKKLKDKYKNAKYIREHHLVDSQKAIDFDTKQIQNMTKELNQQKKELVKLYKDEDSQQKKLEECLAPLKITSQFKDILSNKKINHSYYNPPPSVHVPDTESTNADNKQKKHKDNVYIINGHGGERIQAFNKRVTLSKGKTLVVFPNCGRPNYLILICQFMEKIQNPKYKKLFANPLKYKKQIEKLLGVLIRVYKPGNKIPEIYTDLFYQFTKPNKEVFLKSGVYNVDNIPPLNRDINPFVHDMNNHLGSKSCVKYITELDDPALYNEKFHTAFYDGNLYKNISKNYDDLKKPVHNVNEIMESIGNGVFYFTGCRYAPFKDEKLYKEVYDQSALQQERNDLEDSK